MDNVFWIVWCPQGALPPAKRHSTYESAKVESERLAKEAPGKEFFVLQANSVARCNQVTTTFLMHGSAPMTISWWFKSSPSGGYGIGAGGGTVLKWNGATGGTMLHVANGIEYPQVERLAFDANDNNVEQLAEVIELFPRKVAEPALQAA